VATESCPKSYITAESEGLVEDFLVRRRLGGMNFGELSARQVEAFLMLEQGMGAEEAGVRRGASSGERRQAGGRWGESV